MKKRMKKYKHKNVWLIDDNELDNFINEKIVEAHFYSERVYVSTNGVSALEFINNLLVSGGATNGTCPEVVFIDLNMPIMGGLEFVSRFKQIANTELTNCRIVILTSSINHADRLLCESLSPNIAFVNKPLTKEILETL